MAISSHNRLAGYICLYYLENNHHHVFIMDPVGPTMQCNIVKTRVSPLCAAMQCGSLPGSQGLSVLNPGSP